MKAGSEQGFTLIEVLIATLVLLIGSLGVLGLVTISIQLNGSSRNFQEATLVGQWKLDHLHIIPMTAVAVTTHPDITSCTGSALTAMCRAQGTPGGATRVPGATKAAVTIDEISGGTAGSGNRYQVSWGVTPMTAPDDGLRGIHVVVFWPRNRSLDALPATDPDFVDCPATPALCYRMDFHSYRR